jgi:hypothetical protein
MDGIALMVITYGYDESGCEQEERERAYKKPSPYSWPA